MAKHTEKDPLYTVDDKSGKIKWKGEKAGSQSKKQKPINRVGCVLTLTLGGVAFVLCAQFLLIPFFISGGGNVDTRPVPGDATRFSPSAAYEEIRAYAGENAKLISISAYYVKSDGTMDLTEDYYPRVDYKFAREVPRPADSPPVGAGGTVSGQWYEPIEIDVYEPNQWRRVSGSSNYSYMNKGMERDVDSPTTSLSGEFTDAPACSFADLWTEALAKDAPADAVAIIEYDAAGYDFRITDTGIWLRFDHDCQLTES